MPPKRSATAPVNKRSPTIRMQKAAKIFAEATLKGENRTQGEMLIAAGYSPNIAKQTSKVTRSEAFLELFHKYCPPDRVAEAQNGLVLAAELQTKDFPIDPDISPAQLKIERQKAKEIIEAMPEAKYRRSYVVSLFPSGTALRVYYTAPDHQARAKGLDQIHKITGNYAPVTTNNNNRNLNFSLSDLRKLAEGKIDEEGNPV